ncbi:hypothetical protein HK097_008353, partial [Rhizophlyctis rosea]
MPPRSSSMDQIITHNQSLIPSDTSPEAGQPRFADNGMIATPTSSSSSTSNISFDPDRKKDIMDMDAVRATCIRVIGLHNQSHIIDTAKFPDAKSIRDKVYMKFGLIDPDQRERYGLYIIDSAAGDNSAYRLNDAELMEIARSTTVALKGHLILREIVPPPPPHPLPPTPSPINQTAEFERQALNQIAREFGALHDGDVKKGVKEKKSFHKLFGRGGGERERDKDREEDMGGGEKEVGERDFTEGKENASSQFAQRYPGVIVPQRKRSLANLVSMAGVDSTVTIGTLPSIPSSPSSPVPPPLPTFPQVHGISPITKKQKGPSPPPLHIHHPHHHNAHGPKVDFTISANGIITPVPPSSARPSVTPTTPHGSMLSPAMVQRSGKLAAFFGERPPDELIVDQLE